MTTEESKQLLKRYHAGKCNDLERQIIEETFMEFNENATGLREDRLEQLSAEIEKDLFPLTRQSTVIRLWSVIAAVAAVGLIGIGVLLFYQDHSIAAKGNEVAQDVAPGGNKATLKLANGAAIHLSDAKTGVVIGKNSLKYNDGSLVQDASGTRFSGSLKGSQKNTGPVSVPSLGAKNVLTASTPRGGTYQIILPDGTKVWLNAATVLQFSANLNGEQGDRNVKLVAGEAYFEVFKDKRHPFVVQTGNQKIRVLGTHFNVNTYTKETRTTLLEGSVRVFLGDPGLRRDDDTDINDVVLKPGQQSINNGHLLTVKPADIDLELAWKNGKIEFLDADIQSIMQMLERWYNVKAVYQGRPPTTLFSGSISRSKKISAVLALLESTGDVQFKIEGRRVEILKK